MKSIGIDIGTTTICGAVIENGTLIKTVTKKNASQIQSQSDFERIQDPEIIIGTVVKILDDLLSNCPDAASIGISGQMHGILYTDKNGKAISPLYTWQDGRGNLIFSKNLSYAEKVSCETGSRMSSGYGLVTHFYNIKNGLVPTEVAGICTIGDYAAMTLCGNKNAVMHVSNAASLGCFDLQNLCFSNDACENLGMASGLLPRIVRAHETLGNYNNIPVSVAIGDNQASFIGSGCDDDTILLNVGTGSQISLVSSYVDVSGSIELRPFDGDRYLLVGSSLSGGRAYAILENFFRKVVRMAGGNADCLYGFMDSALDNYSGPADLEVSTLFNGTRDDPSQCGTISGIKEDNFTPEALMIGFCRGIIAELHSLYEKMGCPEKGKLVGSGNGLRRNRALCRAAEEAFGMKLELAEFCEEAACGAAIFGFKNEQFNAENNTKRV